MGDTKPEGEAYDYTLPIVGSTYVKPYTIPLSLPLRRACPSMLPTHYCEIWTWARR